MCSTSKGFLFLISPFDAETLFSPDNILTFRPLQQDSLASNSRTFSKIYAPNKNVLWKPPLYTDLAPYAYCFRILRTYMLYVIFLSRYSQKTTLALFLGVFPSVCLSEAGWEVLIYCACCCMVILLGVYTVFLL